VAPGRRPETATLLADLAMTVTATCLRTFPDRTETVVLP
jgi:hypothetical protein